MVDKCITDNTDGDLSQQAVVDPPLLRPEALEAVADRGLGRPVSDLPLSWQMITISLLLMFSFFAVLLTFGSYSRRETVSGIVRSTAGELRISVPSAGVARRVDVREGQDIKKGAPLLVVDTSKRNIDGEKSDLFAIKILDNEISSINSRLGALNAIAELDRRSIPERLVALESERKSLRAQAEAARERLLLADMTLSRTKPVAARGFVSGESLRRRQEEVIALRQVAAEISARQAQLDGQIAEVGRTANKLPVMLVQERGNLLDLLSKAQRERENILERQGFTVSAPSDGKITALQVSAGQLVDPTQSLMTISRPDNGVLAEIFVPSRAIGFVAVGQRVNVRYDAFPYQRFGQAVGKVSAISSTVLRPEEVASAVRLDEPAYRVLVTLNSNGVSAYGITYKPKPGFALSADIILERRSFIEWLLDPIRALRGRL